MNRKHPTNRNIAAATALALIALIFLFFCSPPSTQSSRKQTNANVPTLTADQPLPGVTIIGLEPAPVLGIVVDRNMQIVYVEKGSATEKGGIKKGDILKGLNSKSVTQPNAAREAFYSLNPSQKSKLVILRDGKEMTLEIRPAKPIARAGQAMPTPAPPEMTSF